jgi:hypothetical protein
MRDRAFLMERIRMLAMKMPWLGIGEEVSDFSTDELENLHRLLHRKQSAANQGRSHSNPRGGETGGH